MKPPLVIAPNDAIYIAGFFDGEGCVGIYRKKVGPRGINERFCLNVSISNTNREVLKYIQGLCGGMLSKPYLNVISRPNRQPIWQWHIQSRQAGYFLTQILPHLRIKKAQAELAVEFAEVTASQMKGARGQRQCRPFTPEDIAYRVAVFEKLKIMKRPYLFHNQALNNLTPQLSL